MIPHGYRDLTNYRTARALPYSYPVACCRWLQRMRSNRLESEITGNREVGHPRRDGSTGTEVEANPISRIVPTVQVIVVS